MKRLKTKEELKEYLSQNSFSEIFVRVTKSKTLIKRWVFFFCRRSPDGDELNEQHKVLRRRRSSVRFTHYRALAHQSK